MVTLWYTSTAAALVWVWCSAFLKARRVYIFDKSVGALTVYLWQVVVSLFWTLLLVLTSLGLFMVQSLES